MKIFTRKHYVAAACMMLVGAFSLASCGGNSNNNSDAELAELQKQLDSTVARYVELKSQSGDFTAEMASRDSIITAQAAEIQRLLDQLGAKKNSSAPAAAVDKKQQDNQKAEIRAKEDKIKQLQKQLDQQEKQLKELRSKSDKASSSTNDKDYQKQIKNLKDQIAQQERQIANLKSQSSKPADCSSVEKQYKSQINDLNGEVKDYKKQISDLQKQISQLNTQVSSLKQSAGKNDSQTAQQLADVQSQLAAAKSELNECKSLTAQLQKDVTKAQNNYQTALNDLELCRADLQSQTAQVKSLQSSASEGGKTESQLRAELAEMAQKEANLRAQNESITKAHAEFSAKCEADKSTLNNNIKGLQNQVNMLQDQVTALTNENGRLTADLQKNANANSATSSQNDAATIADLTAQVESQKAEIANLQKQLEQKNKELASAKSTPTKGTVNQKLAELQALCDSYAAEIERLRAENEQLRNENATLRDKVASSADLIDENSRLRMKVDMASVLVTSDLSAIPGKSVKGREVKPATKAAQTVAVRIDCRILDNNVIDPGSVTIYARIANAANRVLYNGNADEYTFNLNGVSMQYTTKQDIEFTGSGRTLTMLWKKAPEIEMQPGLYWVTLYANGYEIGKTSFKLN